VSISKKWLAALDDFRNCSDGPPALEKALKSRLRRFSTLVDSRSGVIWQVFATISPRHSDLARPGIGA
jgi:hypothetical protein